MKKKDNKVVFVCDRCKQPIYQLYDDDDNPLNMVAIELPGDKLPFRRNERKTYRICWDCLLEILLKK